MKENKKKTSNILKNMKLNKFENRGKKKNYSFGTQK